MFKDGKKYGFPAVAFKAAMVRAGEQLDWKMAQLKVRFFVLPEEKETGLIEIKGKPTMRTDMVRIGMGTSDVRYRPEFQEWKASLRISYNKRGISHEQIKELLMLAGFSVGVGEWRPGKSATGSFGTWRIIN